MVTSISTERVGIYARIPNHNLYFKAEDAWNSLCEIEKQICLQIVSGKKQSEICENMDVCLSSLYDILHGIKEKTKCRDALDFIQLLLLAGVIKIDPWRDKRDMELDKISIGSERYELKK